MSDNYEHGEAMERALDFREKLEDEVDVAIAQRDAVLALLRNVIKELGEEGYDSWALELGRKTDAILDEKKIKESLAVTDELHAALQQAGLDYTKGISAGLRLMASQREEAKNALKKIQEVALEVACDDAKCLDPEWVLDQCLLVLDPEQAKSLGVVPDKKPYNGRH